MNTYQQREEVSGKQTDDNTGAALDSNVNRILGYKIHNGKKNYEQKTKFTCSLQTSQQMHEEDTATEEQAPEPNPWETTLFDNMHLEQVSCKNSRDQCTYHT